MNIHPLLASVAANLQESSPLGMLAVGSTPASKTGSGPLGAAVIVSVTDANESAVYDALSRGAEIDILELRADTFSAGNLPRWIFEQAKPILLTVRTASQGGEAELSGAAYLTRVLELLNNYRVDILDLEYTTIEAAQHDAQGARLWAEIVNVVSAQQLPIIWSHHEWQQQPSASAITDLVARLRAATPAGLPKIAVMPDDLAGAHQFLTALQTASFESVPQQERGAFIAIAMGEAGEISRAFSAAFGSVATFAACGLSSAPGQLAITELSRIREYLRVQDISGAAISALDAAECAALLTAARR